MGHERGSDQQPVTKWIEQSARGDREASEKLYGFYYDEMVRLACECVSPLPPHWQPQEFVDSGVKSLLRWLNSSRARRVPGRNEFRRLIGRFVRRKVARRVEHEMAQKRGGGKTVTETDLGTDFRDLNLPVDQLRPTPAEAVEAADLVDQALAKLKPADREIVELALQGYSNVEIANVIGRSEAAVRQKRKRIAAKCEWLLQELEP